MTPEYQRHIDKIIDGYKQQICKTLVKLPSNEEGAYFLTCFTHDLMNMLFSILRHNMPVQEAKANFKIALDQVLVRHGLSLQIFEFGPGEENPLIMN